MDNDGTLSERNILRFLTAVAIYEDDGYFAQLAMGDDPMVPKNYVTLQSVNVITEQDLSLELDGVFIECSAGLDGYDLVSSISRTADTVEIGLNENEAGLSGISIILTDECRAALDASRGVEIFQERLARPRVLP